MTKRLQVVLAEEEFELIQRQAERERMTTAEWVRHRLREGIAEGSRPNTAARLETLRTAYRHESPAPSPSIDQMLEQIERGYLAD